MQQKASEYTFCYISVYWHIYIYIYTSYVVFLDILVGLNFTLVFVAPGRPSTPSQRAGTGAGTAAPWRGASPRRRESFKREGTLKESHISIMLFL